MKIKLDSIEVERSIRIDSLSKQKPILDNDINLLINKMEGSAQDDVLMIWKYVNSLDYCHEGLSKGIYLVHPFRVASLYVGLSDDSEINGIKLALSHNLLEVTDMNIESLTQEVGDELANNIKLLTVHRELQWDWKYKSNYYESIFNSVKYVKQIKVLDKLDNLFLLCLNRSEETREKYLYEVEKWIMPMAIEVLPDIQSYLSDLIKENRQLGYLPNEFF
jgi:(p)ppGpp synthase/HD superfamily hydrolase